MCVCACMRVCVCMHAYVCVRACICVYMCAFMSRSADRLPPRLLSLLLSGLRMARRLRRCTWTRSLQRSVSGAARPTSTCRWVSHVMRRRSWCWPHAELLLVDVGGAGRSSNSSIHSICSISRRKKSGAFACSADLRWFAVPWVGVWRAPVWCGGSVTVIPQRPSAAWQLAASSFSWAGSHVCPRRSALYSIVND